MDTEAIRARVDAATPGPWLLPQNAAISMVVTKTDPIWWAEVDGREDAQFIAHAREDVPDLLDRVAVLEAELQTTKDALADLEEQRTKLAEELAAIEHFGSYQLITADQDKVVQMPICDVCERPIKWSFEAKKWVHNPPLTRAEWHQPSNADPFSGVTPDKEDAGSSRRPLRSVGLGASSEEGNTK